MPLDYEKKTRMEPKEEASTSTVERATSEATQTESSSPPPAAEETTVETEAEAKIRLGEEDVPVSQVEEWKKGYLRQSDYTQKTQELANQRRQLDAWYQKANADYEAAMRGKQQAETPAENQDPYLAEINTLKGNFTKLQTQLEQERTERSIDLGLNTLSTQHLKVAKAELSQSELDEILEIAKENNAYRLSGNSVDFTPAYKIWKLDALERKQASELVKAEAKGVQKGVQAQVNRSGAATSSARTVGGAPQADENPRLSGIREAVKTMKTRGMVFPKA